MIDNDGLFKLDKLIGDGLQRFRVISDSHLDRGSSSTCAASLINNIERFGVSKSRSPRRRAGRKHTAGGVIQPAGGFLDETSRDLQGLDSCAARRTAIP